MKNYSIWKEDVELFCFDKLDSDIDVDVLIIGGGMTGINTLYQLRNSSLKVVLVEQNKIGMGVTVNSTGKLTYLQDSLYEKIWKSFDKEVAFKYLESQKEAIRLARDIIEKENIDCNLIHAPSYVYANTEDEVKKLDALYDFLVCYCIKVIGGNSDLVCYKKMIGVEDTYLFHPLKYINGLVGKLDSSNIYENTSIVKMDKIDGGYVCYTDDNKRIRANIVVVSSHYPYFLVPFVFPIKGSLEKSYLSASKYKNDNVSLIKYDKPIISMRSYLDYLIYLSNSHDISSDVLDKRHYGELNKELDKLGLVSEFVWSNVDIITNDGLPYIGRIDDNLFLGTGYNTWGMTNGILAGKILADMVMGIDNEYEELFDPKRINLANVGGAVVDSFKNVRGMIKGVVSDNDKVDYDVIDGEEIAIFEDENGKHVVYTKCPHMGCKLIFNELEKTWDCPCHASRFDLDGKCISGPSNKNVSFSGKLYK